MTTFSFSTSLNGQHFVFDPDNDNLTFDIIGVTAGDVRLVKFGANLAFSFGGKTVFLDGVDLNQLKFESLVFSGGGAMLLGDGTTASRFDYYGHDYSGVASVIAGDLQIWGLEGADLIGGGTGDDVLVGNTALTALNHVSRVGGTGSPTSSLAPTISADGRFVAFEGGWTSFGSQSNSATDILVKDMVTGVVTNEHKSASGAFGLSGSGDPVISADGLSVAFVSSSQLLSPTATPSNTVFVAATRSNALEAVSTTAGGVFGNVGGSNPDISADGRYVVFSSRSDNLAAGGNNVHDDIYLKDRLTGALTRISTSNTGGDGDLDSQFAKISADGRFVVFQSAAGNLAGADSLSGTDIYLWDAETGDLTNITGGNPGNFDSQRADVAFDEGFGGVVVFDTGKALVADDTNNANDVYAYEIFSGIFSRVSERADGSGVALASQDASISGDGRFVVFRSFSDDLVTGDSNGFADIFVKDLFTGAIALVSRSAAAQANQAASAAPQISLGGDWIVFETGASNLSGTDGNGGLPDVYRVSNPLLRDTMEGGAGNDTYIIARTDVIIEEAGGGTDLVQSSISYTLGANLENLVLTGAAKLVGSGNALNNAITGNAGANRLSGLAGNDTLLGGLGNDTLLGGLGNDVLNGGAGDDSMVGGAGNDRYVVDSLADKILETSTLASEIDTVQSTVSWTLLANLENLVLAGGDSINGTGNALANTITGNAGNNILSGAGGHDTLIGGLGNDVLNGGAGNDSMVGGTGNDRYIVDSLADRILETSTLASEIDTVQSTVNWTLLANLEKLILAGAGSINGTGNALANTITGNAGSNILSGAGGNDTLIGGGGADVLIGGPGSDRLTGGADGDAFVLNSKIGSDVVTDFVSGVDRLRVSMAGLRIGDGDLLVEGQVLRGAPGGFSTNAELVVFTANQPGLDAVSAAAGIGAATTAFAAGATRLFAVDNGASSAVYLFTAANADAVVSAGELTLLATLTGTPATALADYLFVA